MSVQMRNSPFETQDGFFECDVQLDFQIVSFTLEGGVSNLVEFQVDISWVEIQALLGLSFEQNYISVLHAFFKLEFKIPRGHVKLLSCTNRALLPILYDTLSFTMFAYFSSPKTKDLISSRVKLIKRNPRFCPVITSLAKRIFLEIFQSCLPVKIIGNPLRHIDQRLIGPLYLHVLLQDLVVAHMTIRMEFYRQFSEGFFEFITGCGLSDLQKLIEVGLALAIHYHFEKVEIKKENKNGLPHLVIIINNTSQNIIKTQYPHLLSSHKNPQIHHILTPHCKPPLLYLNQNNKQQDQDRLSPMQQIVEKEINPISNLIIFGGYCFGGVTMLSYFSFRAFRNIESSLWRETHPIQNEIYSWTFQSSIFVFRKIAAAGAYFIGWVYLAWKLNLNDRVFQSSIRKDKDYTDKIKLDPFFQNFYIINTMKYFNISERLIKKTQEELRQKIEKTNGKPQGSNSTMAAFEKSMISLALKVGGQGKLQSLK